MSTTIIKSANSDNMALVDSTGHLYVTMSGGGVASTVNIQDSNGNPITATNGSLNVNLAEGFSNGSPAFITVTNASTLLLAANSNRKYFHITNNSGGPIYIQYGSPAVLGKGIRINAGALYTIGANELWLGAVYAVANSSLVIEVFEGT